MFVYENRFRKILTQGAHIFKMVTMFVIERTGAKTFVRAKNKLLRLQIDSFNREEILDGNEVVKCIPVICDCDCEANKKV